MQAKTLPVALLVAASSLVGTSAGYTLDFERLGSYEMDIEIGGGFGQTKKFMWFLDYIEHKDQPWLRLSSFVSSIEDFGDDWTSYYHLDPLSIVLCLDYDTRQTCHKMTITTDSVLADAWEASSLDLPDDLWLDMVDFDRKYPDPIYFRDIVDTNDASLRYHYQG